MVTIKKTVEMNLHELIKWAWDNDITFQSFLSNNGHAVVFEGKGQVIIDNVVFDKNDTFKVEIEEEIDEYMEIRKIISVDIKGQIYVHEDVSIEYLKHFHSQKASLILPLKFIYLQNDDGSIGELIWKDGEMVDANS